MSHQTSLQTSSGTVTDASQYYSLGLSQKKVGDFKSALQSIQHSLDIRLRLLGEHKDTAMSYHSLGFLQSAMEDFKLAILSHQRALNIRMKVFGEHVDTAWSYYFLAVAQGKSGDVQASLKSHQHALDLRVRLLGDHKDTALSYHTVAIKKKTLGDQIGALQSHQRALEIRQRVLGEHQDTAWSCYSLGLVQKALGDMAASRQSHLLGLKMRLKLLGEHVETALSYYSLGLVESAMGDDMNAALEYHKKALNIRLKLLGNHVDTALSSYSLGNTEATMNNHAGALQAHQRALDIRMKLLGDNTDTVIAYLAVIADLGKLGDMERMKEIKVKCNEMEGHLAKKTASKLPTQAGDSLIVKSTVLSTTFPEVFISYQWDSQELVLELKRMLEESGLHCWMDISQMGGGDALFAQIDAGIRASKVVICCVTAKYCLSENCQREVTLADALRKPIIPLLFDQLDWPPAGQLAMIFVTLLYIDMKPGFKALHSSKFNELLHKIQCHISQ